MDYLVKTKYLTFRRLVTTKKTHTYTVNSETTLLGKIQWYAPWRRYCFFVNGRLIFDQNCLKEIRNFIKALMEERKSMKETS